MKQSSDQRETRGRSVVRRVAYFINQYPAVSHTFIRREIQALEDLGWDVQRFTIRRATNLVDERDRAERDRTSSVFPIALGDLVAASAALLARPLHAVHGFRIACRMALRSHSSFFRSMFGAVEAMLLLWRFRKLEISHAHAHFRTNSAAVLRIVKAFGGPSYSFTSHGPFELDDPYSGSLQEKVRDATFVAAISNFSRAQLMQITPPSMWQKIHVIRCGLPFTESDTEITPVPVNPKLVCIGRLSKEKGQLLMIRAAARLSEEGQPLSLVLIGDGPMRVELEGEVDRLGAAEFVKFLGSTDGATVNELLLSSRALVLPSFAEGLPIVLMECFRVGRPAIAANVGAVAELVQVNLSGWLVQPGDMDELVEAMREALTLAPETLTRMGRAGFEAVKRLHDVDREALKLSSLFERSIEQNMLAHTTAVGSANTADVSVNEAPC